MGVYLPSKRRLQFTYNFPKCQVPILPISGKGQISDLKTDGTFRWLSGGLTYNGYGKLRFQTNSCEIDNLAYHESSATDESFTTFVIAYYINNKLVTKDSYIAFVKEEDAKRDVTWYEFSQENISTVTSKTR